MSVEHAQTIEFFGGPIDGHRAEFQPPLKSLVLVQTMTPHKHRSLLVQLLRRLCFSRHAEPVVLAIYELAPRRSGNRYRYLRSTTSTHLKLDASRVYTMLQSEDQTLWPIRLQQESPADAPAAKTPRDLPARRDIFEQRDT